MKTTEDFCRVKLMAGPTPMYKLENVSRVLGKNIWIKRDDMTGVALGGNKVRKLEFLLADAVRKGAKTVLTTGGAQSNHAMLTAACCMRLGLKPVLLLKKEVFQTGAATFSSAGSWAPTSDLSIQTPLRR